MASFVGRALGAAAIPFIERGGKWLWNKTEKQRNKIGGWFSDIYGGDDKDPLAAAMMDSVYNEMTKKAFNGVHKYANSDAMLRKAPMIANYLTKSADAFRDRLDNGYQAMMAGGTAGDGVNVQMSAGGSKFQTSKGGGGGGGGGQALPAMMDGIERYG